jgi:radical SAM superfamily enzyme with C-terminal helix-hairpin-helix motif
MSAMMAILDGYTVEPSGLGVPPYLSTYVRDAYSALRKAYPSANVRYLTIDDVRWCLNGGAPSIAPPQSDPRTYSATVNRDRAIQVLRDANVVVVVAGDKVPSVHLHAENATTDELTRALACVRGSRVLLGPLATYALAEPAAHAGLFDAIHSHTITSGNLLLGSNQPVPHDQLGTDRDSYEGLVAQLHWCPIAEF